MTVWTNILTNSRRPITRSLHHSITPSLHHSITPSLHHSITPSLHHSITLSPYHLVTLSPCHLVTLSPCHRVTLSPCHPLIRSPPRHLFCVRMFPANGNIPSAFRAASAVPFRPTQRSAFRRRFFRLARHPRHARSPWSFRINRGSHAVPGSPFP